MLVVRSRREREREKWVGSVLEENDCCVATYKNLLLSLFFIEHNKFIIKLDRFFLVAV